MVSPIKQLASPMSRDIGIDIQKSNGIEISGNQAEKITAFNNLIDRGAALKIMKCENEKKHRLDQSEGEKENKHAKMIEACISPSNKNIIVKAEGDDGAMHNDVGIGNDNRVSSKSNDSSPVSNATEITKDEVKLLPTDKNKKKATKPPRKPPAVLAVDAFVAAIKLHVSKTFNLRVQSASWGESSVPESVMDAVRRATLAELKFANTVMMSIGGIGCFSDDALKSKMVCAKLISND